MEPPIRYVRSADGTNIAYAVIGKGVPIIFAPNVWCHIEMQLGSEFGEAWNEMAREGLRIVPYDMRGMGMSDRDVKDFSLESQVADIEALREHLGFDTFALYGNVLGTPAAITYAACNPQRLSHLVLSLPFAHGGEFYRSVPTLQGLETFRGMGDEHWELYTLTHATALVGMYPEQDARGLAELMRVCTTPDVLRRFYLALQTQDVTPLLAEVRTPTLVLAPGPSVVNHRFSRQVAAGISGARMATVPFAATGVAPAAPATRLATEFVLGRRINWPSQGTTAATNPSRTAVILFADIVDSTALTERFGDAAFREKARVLDAALRAIIRDHSGTPIEGKLLGDGVLATFASARQAIEAALACGRAGDDGGLPLHLGLHAGDVIREEGNVFGGAVNVAARISGLSAPGEVLVSQTVRDLARTSAGVAFADRGEQALKGVGEPVRVWAVVHRGNN
jgi:class 3 adenylate cyclase/pimeloyl-ACP methyl ester carboxylesterase